MTDPCQHQAEEPNTPFPFCLAESPKDLRFGVDAMLLASYARQTLESLPSGGKETAVAELGCGGGDALLGVLASGEALGLGIDINKDLIDLAARNAVRMGMDKVGFLRMDLRDAGKNLRDWENRASLVLANPPWRLPSEGRRSASATRRKALWAEPDTFKIFCKAASFLLKHGGQFCCIAGTFALPRLLAEMESCRLGLREILPVSPRKGKPAARILMRAQKNAQSLPDLLPPLVLHPDQEQNPNDKWSAKALNFCPWLGQLKKPEPLI